MANKDSSADAAPASVEDDDSLNYARKAIKQITALGKMRLEERKSNETAEDGIVQVSDVSSSTAAAEEHRQPDDVDSAAENEQSVSSSSSDEASLSHVDVSAASDPASVEVAVEKHVTSVNDMDGLAVCLT